MARDRFSPSKDLPFYTDQRVTVTATSYDERGGQVTGTYEARVFEAEDGGEGYWSLHLLVPETD
jgi:hypothetical protein